MASKLNVINFALSHLGQAPISSLTGNSAGAVQGNLWIEQAREELLVAYPWIFATGRKRLKEKELNVFERQQFLNEWFYYYLLPDEALFVQYIVDQDTANQVYQVTDNPFTIELNPSNVPNEPRKVMLTNVAEAVAVYTRDINDYSAMPPYFIQPLSMLLASYIAYPLTSDINMRKELYSTFIGTLGTYTSQDANQQKNKRPQESETVRSRWSSYIDYGNPY